jgi:hypothetical protein
MPQVTLDQRRLEALRQQLYGKEKKVTLRKNSLPSTGNYKLSENSLKTVTVAEDTTYLRNDLLKIAIFSFVAISLQLILFMSLRVNLINLKF